MNEATVPLQDKIRHPEASTRQADLCRRRQAGRSRLWTGAVFSVLLAVLLTSPQARADGWESTGRLVLPRIKHTSTLLLSGKMLVVGGGDGNVFSLSSAEVYDPATGSWTLVPESLDERRNEHTATLLPSGKVLVTGGIDGDTRHSSVEVYDPATGSWTSSNGTDPSLCDPDVVVDPHPETPCPLAEGRRGHTATLLPSGKVLLAGGANNSGPLSSAELFDPATNRWSRVDDDLEDARTSHTATLLPSGKVLLAGGQGDGRLSSAEVYDPANGDWTTAGGLQFARASHTATLLPSGKVLVAGGSDPSRAISSAELYDPANPANGGSWTSSACDGAEPPPGVPCPLRDARASHTATLLPSGQVLVAGGINSSGVLSSAELYDPANPANGGSWTSSACDGAEPPPGVPCPLIDARASHTATLLPTGEVLVAGGEGPSGPLSSVELFDPVTGIWASSNATDSNLCDPNDEPHPREPCPLAAGRHRHTATLLPSGKVLVLGGFSQAGFSGPLASAELYDPATGIWTEVPDDEDLLYARGLHTATLLPSGEVLVAAGRGAESSAAESSAEMYDPGNGSSVVAGLHDARRSHTATLLPSGRVLVAGGQSPVALAGAFPSLSSAEVFDPATRTWTRVGSLQDVRTNHTATLLPSGEVLVAAGLGNDSRHPLSSAEVYHPVTGSWTPVPETPDVGRLHHTATLLPSGKVLVAAGFSGGYQEDADVYDRATGSWTPVRDLQVARRNHTATLLPSGKVLVAGGRDGGGPLASAELYDDPGFLLSRPRPMVDGVPPKVDYLSPIEITGTGFGGDSEAGGGTSGSSAANLPLVQLRALEGGAQGWLSLAPLPVFCPDNPDATSPLGFCNDQEATLRVTDLPDIFHPGPHLLTVVSAGVPSGSELIHVECSLSVTDPQDVTVGIGEQATFPPVESQGGRLFQWQQCQGASSTTCAMDGLGWIDIPGATAASYTTPLITGPESGTRYRVVADSGCTTRASAAATLTVEEADDPSVDVLSPDGGEFWLLSDPDPEVPANTELVTWSMSDNVRVCSVDVELFADDGGPAFDLKIASFGSDPPPPASPPCFFPGEETQSAVFEVPRTSDELGGSGRQYKVRVTVTDHAGNTADAESEHSFFIVRPDDDSVKTLILWHSDRLEGRFDDAQRADLGRNLESLADHPLVQGRLVDLAGVASLAPLYAAWDADPGNVALANAVLFADGGIQDHLVNELLEVFTGVEYLVLAGDDPIIPMARLEDAAEILTEKDYPGGLDLTGDTTVGQALAANQYLSDDPLATRDRVALDPASGSVAVPQSSVCSDAGKPDLAYIPDLAVGRLVEEPAEMITTIATFISQAGILDLTGPEAPSNQVLVTGYDFLLDSAGRISQRWQSFVGAEAVGDDLVDPAQAWGASDLLAGLCGDGGTSYPIASLNGHANHFGEGVPGTDPLDIQGLDADLLQAPDACGAGPDVPLDLAGAVFYAVGCHGGLPVPGSDPDDDDHSFDLTQSFLSRGVVAYVANTGYGWGLLQGPPGYGERMVVLATEELTAGGTVTIGEAIQRTKRRYFTEDSGCFDAFDQKSVMQWTLFGLPMYAVRTPIGGARAPRTAAAPPTLEELPAVQRFGGITVERREAPVKATLPPFLTRLDLHFDFSAEGVYSKYAATGGEIDLDTDCPDTEGCWYELGGLASGQADLPVQPYFVFDSRLAGTSQHGVLWKGGVYSQEQAWQPLRAVLQSNNTDAFADLGALARRNRGRARPTRLVPGEDPDEAAGCPASDVEVNTLVVPAGETVQDAFGQLSIERRDLEVDLEILYFNDTSDARANCDREGPDLGAGPYHQVAGTTVEWSVTPSDASGVWRVVAVIDDGPIDTAGTGAHVPVELADDGTGTWRGSYDLGGLGALTYFLQAVDTRGNVSWLLFDPGSEPSSGIDAGLPEPVEVAITPGTADLSVDLAEAADPVGVLGPLAYTVRARNLGPDPARFVTVVHTLPAGVSGIAVDANGWSCAVDAGVPQVSCTLAGLAPGLAPPFSVAMTAPADAGTITSKATVASLDADPDPLNNTGFAPTSVSGDVTDLTVELAASAAASAGGPLSYSLVVGNRGPQPVSGAAVRNDFPPELLAVDWSCTATPGSSCAAAGSGTIDDTVDLAPGGLLFYTATGTVDAGASGLLLDVAAVTPPPGVVDLDPANNAASLRTHLPIFTDGFESGDVAVWSNAVPSDLRVVVAESGSDARAGRLRLGPGELELADGASRLIVAVDAESGRPLLELALARRGERLVMMAAVRFPDGTRAESGLIELPTGATASELRWQGDGEPIAPSFELRVDGLSVWRLDR